jgi:ribose 5-phosphate isomerase RpiB
MSRLCPSSDILAVCFRKVSETGERRIIVKWMSKKWTGGADETELAQDVGMWLAVVTAVMNFGVP